MSFYQLFNVVRTTEPDYFSLIEQLKALDSSAGIQHEPGNQYVIKKSTPWTAPQVNAVLNILETAPEGTPQLLAQGMIDRLPIITKAIVLALIDELNILRAQHGLAARTPAQAIQAIRDKAATL